MRTTLDVDDGLVRRAAELTGESDETTLVRLGLEALIAREGSRRLAGAGGSDQDASAAQRRRGSFVPADDATATFGDAPRVDAEALRRDLENTADQDTPNRE